MAFPLYRTIADGGGLRVPEYKRGHHPNCRANQSTIAGWSKGLTKNDHPSISRMGFQPGHKPYNDWSHVNHKLATDQAFKAKWIANKIGQKAWNKGLRVHQYKNPFPSGSEHGSWKGGKHGLRDSNAWKTTRDNVFKRDGYTCQHCGDVNRLGRGSRIKLECHHVVPACIDPSRFLDESNLITLCFACHKKEHGNKVKKAAP
jgi:5-methylcytosine-specific restriction protein A